MSQIVAIRLFYENLKHCSNLSGFFDEELLCLFFLVSMLIFVVILTVLILLFMLRGKKTELEQLLLSIE